MTLAQVAGAFASPQAVVDDPTLSRQQKWRILREWELDAISLEVAAEEGMPTADASGLEEVCRALLRLGNTRSCGPSP